MVSSAAVIIALHPKGKYRKIALVRLVGIMLIVFVKEQHAAYVRGVATDTVGTGIMGKLVCFLLKFTRILSTFTVTEEIFISG